MALEEKILKELRRIKLFIALGFLTLAFAFIYNFTKFIRHEGETLIKLLEIKSENYNKKKKPLPERI